MDGFLNDDRRVDVAVQHGQRLRGSEPVVRRCFHQFVEDGVPEREWPSHFATVEEQSAVAREAAEAASRMDVHLAEPPQWAERPDALVLLESVRGGHGYGSNASLPTGYTTVPAGVLVHRDAELVQKRPDLFAEIDWTPAKPTRRAA